MESEILPKAKVACTDPQYLQYLNNPIIVSAKAKRQRSELTKCAFSFPYILSSSGFLSSFSSMIRTFWPSFIF